MSAGGGAFAVVQLGASALLILSGIAKLRNPKFTREALATSGLPSGVVAVALLASAEILVAAAMVVVGGRDALLAGAAMFAGFSAFVVQAALRGLPLRTCGCFGRDDTPISRIHIALSGLLALSLGADALWGDPGGAPQLISGHSFSGAIIILLGAAAALLLYGAFDPLTQMVSKLVFRPKRSRRATSGQPQTIGDEGRMIPLVAR